MATLAQLDVIYTANTRSLTQGLREATQRSRSAARQIGQHARQMTAGFRRSINSVVNLRAAVGVLAGTSGIGLLVRSQMQAIDTTAKFARMIGESAREVSSLQHAAEITAGVTDKQFNMALQRMTRRVAEAANGTGEAKDAIAELGLEAGALVRAGPAEAFRMIADAIREVEDPAQRVRIAFKLFDSEGAKLVNTLNVGSAGIRELQAEADALGRSFTDLDAAQIEAANDALTRMGGALSGVGRTLTIQLAGPIVAVSEQIRSMSQESVDFGQAFVTAGGVILEVIGKFADGVHGLRIIWKGLQVIATGVIATITTAIEGIVVFFAKTIDRINGLVNDAIRAFNRIPGVDIPLLQSVATSGFVQGVREAAATSRKVLSATRDDLHGLMMESLPSEAIDTFFREAQARMADLRASVNGGSESSGEGGETGTSRVASPDFDAIRSSVDESMEMLKDGADEHFLEIGGSLSRSLIAGMKDGTSGALDVLSQSLERWATTLLDSAFMSALKGLPFGGGGGAAAGLGSLFAGFFADGGRIPAGQFGVVGERGPELVSGPAMVTPQRGGSPTLVNNISISGGATQRDAMMVERAVKQGQAQLLDELSRRGRI